MLDAVDKNPWPPVDVHANSGSFRLSREERDYIAGHALDSVAGLANNLGVFVAPPDRGLAEDASACARKIAALSNLLGDIGWERRAPEDGGTGMPVPSWFLGELFPVAQLRPWLEEWQRQDNEALINAEQALEVAKLAYDPSKEPRMRQLIADAQTKLGTGAILLARLEKWMACRGN